MALRQQGKQMTASLHCRTPTPLNGLMSWPQPSFPRLSDTAPRATGIGVVTAKLRLLQLESCLLTMHLQSRGDVALVRTVVPRKRSSDAFPMPAMS